MGLFLIHTVKNSVFVLKFVLFLVPPAWAPRGGPRKIGACCCCFLCDQAWSGHHVKRNQLVELESSFKFLRLFLQLISVVLMFYSIFLSIFILLARSFSQIVVTRNYLRGSDVSRNSVLLVQTSVFV